MSMSEKEMRWALQDLIRLEKKQGGLLNGNFAPIAKRHNLKVKELRRVYDTWKAQGYYIFVEQYR